MDEHVVQIEVSEWLQRKVGAEVYWAEAPPEVFESFRFEDVRDRPDLLVTGNLNIVVELKDGNDSAGIYDAMSQLHEYWRSYEYDGAQIITNQGTVEVDAFVIATQYSPDGHLFKLEREQGYRQTYENHEAGWNQDMRPQFEYARTEAIPRIQWRYAWNEAEKRQDSRREQIATGLGVLLSQTIDETPDQSGLGEFNDDSTTNTAPMALIYSGEDKATWAPV